MSDKIKRKPPRFGGPMIADIAIPWVICNDPGPKSSVKKKTTT